MAFMLMHKSPPCCYFLLVLAWYPTVHHNLYTLTPFRFGGGCCVVNPPVFPLLTNKKEIFRDPNILKIWYSKPDIDFQRMKSDLAYDMPRPHESFDSTSSGSLINTS